MVQETSCPPGRDRAGLLPFNGGVGGTVISQGPAPRPFFPPQRPPAQPRLISSKPCPVGAGAAQTRRAGLLGRKDAATSLGCPASAGRASAPTRRSLALHRRRVGGGSSY